MTMTDPVSPDLRHLLRALKLGQLTATLPEGSPLARQQKMPHADFLELLLAKRGHPPRERVGGPPRPRRRTRPPDAPGNLGPLSRRPPLRPAALEQARLPALRRCRTRSPSSSGPSASARRTSPPPSATSPSAAASPLLWPAAGHLFKKLKAARLDSSTEAEHRRLAAVNVLIIDDFALQPLDELATADFYELTVARAPQEPDHRHQQPHGG